MGKNWKRAFTYLAADYDYRRKLLFIALASLVPIVNCTVLGYGVNIYRNIIDGKKDADLQPEWETCGDFMLKGFLAMLILFGYGIVCGMLVMIFGLLSGAGIVGTLMTGGELSIGIFIKIIVALIALAGTVFFWAGYTLYSESLEVTRAFRIIEVLVRIKTLGKPFFVAVALWAAFSYGWSYVTDFLPLSMYLFFVGCGFASLVLVYYLAQLSLSKIHPVLTDVINGGLMEYAESVRQADDEMVDEYGYIKKGGHKASHYIDHDVTEQLTWSTDSDTADEL